MPLPFDREDEQRTAEIQKGLDLLHRRDGCHAHLIGLPDDKLRHYASRATHQHYKGGLYRSQGVAIHAETKEVMSIYCHVFPYDYQIYVRPRDIFEAYVTLENGDLVRRFRKLDFALDGWG